ncbi:MAG: Leucine-, isoleucine-, valine-, threonine-, and alanine-binding protein BraC [Thermoanaerobacterales bacterium 50_218]|nr:MAG: Leucine-, isoleucine-, valine-, threonine-, and alanine-binding protein BraC [Thermoanaerobacterales bacterium 50_218]HAA89771.1 ethanolamine utilization protein EutJ [Peptococcaceae bacterium]
MAKLVSSRKLRYYALATAVFFLLGVLLSGCGAPQKQSEAEKIKIGINYELSGKVATYGTSCKNGVVLALEEINKAGGVLGKQIEVIVRDNKSDTAESVNVATQLASMGVVAMIGPATTGDVMAAEPVATSNRIPLLTTSATAPTVTFDEEKNKVREYIFRICIIDPDQAMVMADFVWNNLKLKKGAIMMDTGNDYSKGLAEKFKEYFEAKGGKIVATEGFVDTDTVFKPQLTKIWAKKPEFIYIPAYYNQVGLIVKQARELGIDVPFLGADGWDSPELVSIAGAKALNNTYFTNHYSSQDPSPEVQAFVKAYKEKYGVEPDSFAALGYDAGRLMAEAIKQAGAADPQKIRDALEKIKDFPGITGKLSFDEKHNPIKEVAIIKMVDGKQELVTKLVPKR